MLLSACKMFSVLRVKACGIAFIWFFPQDFKEFSYVFIFCYIFWIFLDTDTICAVDIQQKQPPELFYVKSVLRNFTKFTGKHLCQSVFFNKVAGFTPVTLIKKRFWHRYFLVNFVKLPRTPFYRTLLDDYFWYKPHLWKKYGHLWANLNSGVAVALRRQIYSKFWKLVLTTAGN